MLPRSLFLCVLFARSPLTSQAMPVLKNISVKILFRNPGMMCICVCIICYMCLAAMYGLWKRCSSRTEAFLVPYWYGIDCMYVTTPKRFSLLIEYSMYTRIIMLWNQPSLTFLLNNWVICTITRYTYKRWMNDHALIPHAIDFSLVCSPPES